MRFMANELRHGRPAIGVMEWTRKRDAVKAALHQRPPAATTRAPAAAARSTSAAVVEPHNRKETMIDIELHPADCKAVVTIDGQLFTEYRYGH